ncbi:right-handed parallel beta-helix repeat-containing protein [Fusibacter sp. 3D3]|uniref:right-handed parallel beta-helix repeat-containing protein n=1 Tax=Fusibacter sp. 3D3 TaxID=1048380 RepID=UPI000853656C|nr:right-handed parallel beta-helix repeat-containing protein [Fusibacter sp. 3D3]GAU77032.1 hypothetical protein F3D3_1631 [Fusibacter sp. 3D3]
MILTQFHKKCLLYLILILFISLSATGCSKKNTENEAKTIPNAGDIIQSSGVNLNEFVRYELNETLYYKGVDGLNRYESCVRIDEILSPNIGKLYFFEGETEALSEEVSEDYSFYKAYEVTDTHYALYYDDQNEMILLKNDILEGSKWKTSMIEPDLGMLAVEATVEKIENDEITVRYKFIDNQNIPVAQQYTLEYVFKAGQGIVKEKRLYSDYELELQLTQKSSDTPNTFVSRYNKPSELISKIYPNTYFKDLISDSIFKQKMRRGHFNDNELYQSYKDYLNQLQVGNMGNISRAKEMLRNSVTYTQNPLELVRQFIAFYELNCYDYGHVWIEQLELYDNAKLEALFVFDEHKEKTRVNPQLKGEYRAVGAYFIENGMSIKYEEGHPYFSTSADFLDQAVNVVDPISKDYVAFKKRQYTVFPIQSEGYLTVSAEELAHAIKAFDADYQAHRDLKDFEEAKYLADYLFELYILPNGYFSEDYNYKDGYITEAYLESYKAYIQENPKSSYTPILINVVKILKMTANAYSQELDRYLTELGYSPMSDTFALKFMQMEMFSDITEGKKRILLNPKASEVVTVSNTEAFLSAIGPNKTIYLKPGLYEIPYQVEIENAYVQVEEGTLRIKNVENMTVLSESGIVDILADSYLEVLVYDGCENIQMEGIRLGHLRTYCIGDVLSVKASKQIEINKVILFGCGYNGLNLEDVTGLSLSNSLISDCQACGLVFKDVNQISIKNTQFYRNGRQLFDFKNALNVTLTQVVAADNDKEAYEAVNALMTADELSTISFIKSKLETTFVQKRVEGSGAVTQEE